MNDQLFYIITLISALVYGIIFMLLPFFVLRIRNEVISINKKLGKLLPQSAEPVNEEKVCTKCSTRNRHDEFTCINCGEPLNDFKMA